MSTLPATQTPPTGTPCPPKAELKALLRGDLPPSQAAAVTDHVGDCPGCQGRLDDLATAETPVLPAVVRDIDRLSPPPHSALWKAIDSVVVEVTTRTSAYKVTPRAPAVPSDDSSSPDADLSFLRPSGKPGRVGALGEFEVLRLIGRGGMGLVLHGFDPYLQRDVAIKVLDPVLSSNKSARQRFCREARAAAAVTHENVVTVYQVNEDDQSGLPYLVMQLVNGESLEQRLRRGKLSVAEATKLGAQAAAGLAAAHATGLIHRDVKPGNMLIEAGDRLKLTDFGLARAAEDLKLTRTGYVSGTPLYMAPEQARGDEIDARADLFSLGVVLYEALAGKPPFEGKTPVAVLRSAAEQPHPPLARVNPDVPGWLEDVVDGLLAKEPKDRIQSAAEVAAVLAAHAHANGSKSAECAAAAAPCPLTPPKALSNVTRRKYRRRMAALLAMPFLLGLGLGVIGAWGFGLGQDAPTVVTVPTPAGPVAADEPIAGFVKEFASEAGSVWSTDASPDGHTLAVGLEDGRIRLIDTIDGHVKITLNKHTGPVWSIDFHHDGVRFASASDDGTVKMWHIDRPEPLWSWPVSSGARAVAISKLGTHLAIGDRSGDVQILALNGDEKPDQPVEIFQHGGSVNAVAFSQPHGLTVASAGSNSTIKLWDLTKPKAPARELPGHKGPVYGLAFSQCGGFLASAGWDKVVRVWNPNNSQLVKELKGHEYDVWSVAYDERNQCDGHLATAGGDGTIRLWDPESGKELKRFKAHKPVAHVVRFATDGSQLISGGRDGVVRLWKVTD
jgi:WD40 repeat protein